MREDRFPFKAVIFDMDGVIVDTEAYYQVEQRMFFADMGISVSDGELAGTVGESHQTFMRRMSEWLARGGIEVSPHEAVERYEAWALDHPRDYAAMLNPGVADTLDELRRRGVRVALASSSPMDNIRAVLAACGLLDAFEVIVSGEQFRESKPDPEIYLHTLDLLGLPADECCCVEDSVPGIAAGKAAGLTVFAKREERFGFSQDAADAIIDQVPDLLTAACELKR